MSYDIHIDLIRFYKTYTDPIGNMILLLNYSDKDLKFYHANPEVLNAFVNKTNRYEFIDLNKNVYYKSCEKFCEKIKNRREKNHEISAGKQWKSKYRHAFIENNKLFVTRKETSFCVNIIDNNGKPKDYFIIDGQANKFIKEKENKVFIDRNFHPIYRDNFFNGEIITYNKDNKKTNNKLVLKNRIELNTSLLKTFDEKCAFVNLPSYTSPDNDFFHNEIFNLIKSEIIDNPNNPIEKIILITGDNRYKQMYPKKYNWITTTHMYEQSPLYKHENKRSSKVKGKIGGYLQDLLYIQESKAAHIDYGLFIKTHLDKLEKRGIHKTKMWKRHSWTLGVGLDPICREIKVNKNLLNPEK